MHVHLLDGFEICFEDATASRTHSPLFSLHPWSFGGTEQPYLQFFPVLDAKNEQIQLVVRSENHNIIVCGAEVIFIC